MPTQPLSPLGAAPADERVMRGQYDSAPSSRELLARAALHEPARMSWESIIVAVDPVLDEKRTPHVAERRARFTHAVKIGLAACVGICVVALGVSALSGDASPSAGSATATGSFAKTSPSLAVVTVESMSGAKRGKARRHAPAPGVTAASHRAKHH
jgi:negative regulator of sigma E activity